MNVFATRKKLLLFGLFGALGCLAGWAVGEGYLAVAQEAAGASQGPSLITAGQIDQAPPPNEDFRQRLEKAKAQTGDIQISLIWFNSNDLDLHCIDPSNFEICFESKYSPATRGRLDVDRNAACHDIDPEPVENIFWAKGAAPMGRYQVYVDYFQQCPRGPDDSTYQVSVLHGGDRKEFRGTINKSQHGINKKLIYEFDLKPLVKVVTPPEIPITRGNTLRLPVAVIRSFYSGKLNLRAESLPPGITATAASLDAGENEGAIELKASTSAAGREKLHFKVVAEAPDVPSVHDEAVPELEVLNPPFSWTACAIIGIWTALLAVGLCLALVAGQNWYLGRPWLASGRVPLLVVIAGTLAAGFVSGSIGQTLYLVLLGVGASSLGFLVGWILLGFLLGFGISYFVPNLDRQKAALAGMAGGLLGAIGYLVWSQGAEWLGRLAGAGLLGFCIGLMVAIVEAAFRRVWLEVRFGERETIEVNLGPEPVKIGGDARACTIWARGAAHVALRYFVRDGKVLCEDTPSRSERIVGHGDTRTVGNVTLTVRTGPGLIPALPRPNLHPLPASVPEPLAKGAAKPEAIAKEAPIPVVRPQTPAPPAPPTQGKPPVAPLPKPPVPAAPPRPAMPPKPPVPTIGGNPPKPPAASPPPKPPMPTARPPVPTPRLPVPSTNPTAVPTAVKPPAPTTLPKPPLPAAAPRPPVPPPAAPATPVAGGAKAADPNACPSCGRITPGRPGARFCMICDKSY